jgi:hypothetical protein
MSLPSSSKEKVRSETTSHASSSGPASVRPKIPPSSEDHFSLESIDQTSNRGTRLVNQDASRPLKKRKIHILLDDSEDSDGGTTLSNQGSPASSQGSRKDLRISEAVAPSDAPSSLDCSFDTSQPSYRTNAGIPIEYGADLAGGAANSDNHGLPRMPILRQEQTPERNGQVQDRRRPLSRSPSTDMQCRLPQHRSKVFGLLVRWIYRTESLAKPCGGSRTENTATTRGHKLPPPSKVSTKDANSVGDYIDLYVLGLAVQIPGVCNAAIDALYDYYDYKVRPEDPSTRRRYPRMDDMRHAFSTTPKGCRLRRMLGVLLVLYMFSYKWPQGKGLPSEWQETISGSGEIGWEIISIMSEVRFYFSLMFIFILPLF